MNLSPSVLAMWHIKKKRGGFCYFFSLLVILCMGFYIGLVLIRKRFFCVTIHEMRKFAFSRDTRLLVLHYACRPMGYLVNMLGFRYVWPIICIVSN